MASIADILRSIQTQITYGLNDPTTPPQILTPGQVVVGWPTGSQGANIWGANQYLVTLFAGKAHRHTRYRPQPYPITAFATPALSATVSNGPSNYVTIALSGTNAAGNNIHTIFGPKTGSLDALYQTTGGESLPALASIIAGQINAFASPGISATSIGASIQISGGAAGSIWCNVGQSVVSSNSPTYVQEIGRYKREVQVTIWVPIPDAYNSPVDGVRESIETAVLGSIGGTQQAWNFAPDGSAFSALWESTGDWSDVAESSYTVFKSDNFLEVEYPLLIPVSATAIGSAQLVQQINSNPSTTLYRGGP